MSSDDVDEAGSQQSCDGEEWSDSDASFGYGSGGEDDIRCEIERERTAVETLTSMCGVSDSDARAILTAFNWDCDEACSAYLEDQMAVCLKAGILDLANGPAVHDTEGTVWKSLWMHESASGLQPYCWDDQWQIDQAYRMDPQKTVYIKNEHQLGQRSSHHSSAPRAVDLSHMVETASGRRIKYLPLTGMPSPVQELVRDLKCHPLIAYRLLERFHLSQARASQAMEQAKALWDRLAREFESEKTPAHEIVDGRLFSPESQKRMIKELTEFKGAGHDVEVDLIDDQLSHWEIRVYKEAFDKDCALYKDMTILPSMKPGKQNHLVFEVLFDPQYPASPPFVFLKSPCLQIHTGHVALNGAICLELLANTGSRTGYNSDYSLNTLFRLILTNMIEPSDHTMFRAARIDFSLDRGMGYNAQAARADFRRVASMHGWAGAQSSTR